MNFTEREIRMIWDPKIEGNYSGMLSQGMFP